MTLQQQITTLAQSKRLKELGVRQDNSLATWRDSEEYGQYCYFGLGAIDDDEYASFTVSELVAALDSDLDYIGKNYTLNKWGHETVCNEFTYHDTLAEAFAAKLINALENNYITAAEVNDRL
jgi:hypothetical protein